MVQTLTLAPACAPKRPHEREGDCPVVTHGDRSPNGGPPFRRADGVSPPLARLLFGQGSRAPGRRRLPRRGAFPTRANRQTNRTGNRARCTDLNRGQCSTGHRPAPLLSTTGNAPCQTQARTARRVGRSAWPLPRALLNQQPHEAAKSVADHRGALTVRPRWVGLRLAKAGLRM